MTDGNISRRFPRLNTLICADPTPLTDQLAPSFKTSAKIRVTLDLRKSAGKSEVTEQLNIRQ